MRQPLDSFAKRFFRKIGKTSEFERPINEEAKRTCRELGKQLAMSLGKNA